MNDSDSHTDIPPADEPPSGQNLSANEESRPPIEIGVVLAGRFDAVDLNAIGQAIGEMQRRLKEAEPAFAWKISRLRRPEGSKRSQQEPSDLLQAAADDRDRHHWDFAISITAAELTGHYRRQCFAALSRPLDAAVISTALVDPIISHPDVADEVRVDAISRRLQTLMLHAVSHLAGLAPQDQPTSLLYHPEQASQLESMNELTDAEREEMRKNLRLVSDVRLEDSPRFKASRIGFFVHAAWINRGEIGDAIWAARPWQFPWRLSRLTTAAVSTVAILLMTAEAWDLGLDQPWTKILTLMIGTIICTTGYVAGRQQLLVRRKRRHTEQTVVTTVSSLSIVATGMLSTWISMCILSLFIGGLLFDSGTIHGWAENAAIDRVQTGWTVYFRMSCFTASLAILIGALGASFESHHHFRHIIFVDEEL